MFRKFTFILTLFAFLLAACGAPAPSAPAPTAVSTEIPATIAPTVAPTPTALGQAEAPTATPAALIFTDGLGREIKLAGPAQRIVSLAPSNTEILFAVGAGKQVVGRDDFSAFPAEVTPLPKIGSLDKQNTEQIVALKPDLVLAAEINSQEQVKAL